MLRLNLLGRPLIERSGKSIEGFRSRKIEALLYFLALTPEEPHQRTQLAALLWPDVSEKKSRRNLRYALWNLRQVLDDIPLYSDRLAVSLPESDNLLVDIITLEDLLAVSQSKGDKAEVMPELQRLAADYRGEFLEGFELEDAPFFEDWLQAQRVRVNNLVIEMLTRLTNYYVTQQQLPEAIETVRQLIKVDPWQEKSQRQLMTLLVLTGQRKAAVGHYQAFVQTLEKEIGVEPEPETIALIERIRTGHLAQPNAIVESKHVDNRESLVPFIGHRNEYIELTKLWEQGTKNESGLVLVRGVAGVGKTRIVEELGRYVKLRGGAVLHGRCYEFSGSLPYHAIAMAIKPQIDNIKAGRFKLQDSCLNELGQLLPELRSEDFESPPHLIARQETDRYRLFEAIVHLIEAMANEQPLLLAIDDLHWTDVETLDLLGYLVRRLSTAPVLIVGTYRPGEVATDHALIALRRPLYNAGLDREILLDALSYETVMELVATLGSAENHPNFAPFLYEISQGNPFILFEAIDEMRERGWLKTVANQSLSLALPPNCLVDISVIRNPDLHVLCRETASCQPITDRWARLTDSEAKNNLSQEQLQLSEVKSRITRRIARLPIKSQQLLAIAALSGHAFDVQLLHLASGMNELEVLDYLEDWVARPLVKPIEIHAKVDTKNATNQSYLQYDFSHDLIRAVVYHGLSPLRKQVFHRQLGEALEKQYVGRLEYIVERLAHHFYEGSETLKALHYLFLAGQQARAVYALSIARTRYRQALDCWEQAYNVSADLVPTEAWRKRWDLLYSLNEVNRMLGQQSTQNAMLEAVVDEVPHWGDERDRLRMIEQQLAQLEYSADLKQRRQLARDGLKSAQLLQDTLAEAQFLQAWADCDRDMGNHDEAQRNYEQAISYFITLEQVPQHVSCLVGLGKIHTLNNNFGQALSTLERAVNYAQTAGCHDVLVESLNSVAELMLYLGNLDGAMDVSRKALGVCNNFGFTAGASCALVTQSRIHLLNNDLVEAEKLLERALSLTIQTGQSLRIADVQCSLGHLKLAQQNYRHALAHFEQTEALSGSFYHGRAIEARSFRAIAHLRLGELNEALVASHHAVVWLSGREHGMHAPQRVYWNQHEVMLAHWETVEAQEALVKAYRLVRDQLKTISEAYPASVSDTLIQNQFCARLPWNQDIVTMWDMLPLTNSHSALHFAG